MKKIIVCCDGTWNSPKKKKNGIHFKTNVEKICNAIAKEDENGILQMAKYVDGIGTDGSKLKQLFEGATGHGIKGRILEGYEFIIDNYEVGDELYFLGFSRGAFTVRSLTGLIRNSGILKQSEKDKMDKAYKLYKSRKKTNHPDSEPATLFRKNYAIQDTTKIKFIGVWDTVGSLGNPLFINSVLSKLSFSVMGNKFHDTKLSSYVENAFQAFAVNEYRRHFKPTVWDKKESSKNKEIEQVWFVGSHSNIGGGLESSDLSDITLEWMLEKARSCNLKINDIEGFPKFEGEIEKSWNGFYKVFPKYYRPIGAIKNGHESLDNTVRERINGDPEYRPKNLEKYIS